MRSPTLVNSSTCRLFFISASLLSISTVPVSLLNWGGNAQPLPKNVFSSIMSDLSYHHCGTTYCCHCSANTGIGGPHGKLTADLYRCAASRKRTRCNMPGVGRNGTNMIIAHYCCRHSTDHYCCTSRPHNASTVIGDIKNSCCCRHN